MGTTPNYNIQYPDSGDQWDLINDLQALADTTDTAIDGVETASKNASNLTSGTVATGRLPVGTVLQVVNGTSPNVVSNTTTTYVDTSLSATITPKNATSKILVHVVQYLTAYTTTAAPTSAAIKILRDSTDIWVQATPQNPSHYLGATQGVATTQSITHLDSPATTSAVTYKTQFATNAQTNVTWRANANANNQLMLSSITLIEVAA